MQKVISLAKLNAGYLIKFLALLALATGAPLAGLHSQWITGPIVNAALILSVFLIGIRGALLIGILPSTIALSTGLLPPILAPMIPFIIISNSILVLVVDWFSNLINQQGGTVSQPSRRLPENYWLGLFFAAGLKYLFLFASSSLVVKLLLNSALAPKVAAMMSYPQFFTALIGGIIAFGILKIFYTSTRL